MITIFYWMGVIKKLSFNCYRKVMDLATTISAHFIT